MKRRVLYCGILVFLIILAAGCNRQEEMGNFEKESEIEGYPSFTVSGNIMEYASDTSFSVAGDMSFSNDYTSITEKIRNSLEDDKILTCSSSSLTFFFMEKVPKRIEWSEYYLNEDGNFVYATEQDIETEEGTVVHVVDEQNESTNINFGLSKARLLSSSDAVIYRCIRLIFEYENEQIEYILLFDSKLLSYQNS